MSECYSFVVNGVPCSTEEEKPLLRYLRDELRLTSVKDGCSEGACGTCTILVDGKAVKACVLSTKRAAGKEIVTVEGLSEAEREPSSTPSARWARSSAASASPAW